MAVIAALLVAGCAAGADETSPDEPTVVEVRPGVTVAVELPDGDGPHPVVVHVPGGGWTTLDDMDVREAYGHAEAVADGWAVATVRYRLAAPGEIDAVAQAEDVAAALDWITGAPAEHALGEPVIAMGHSAGAHLLALAVAREPLRRPPDALLLVSGVYEFRVEVPRSRLLRDGLAAAQGCRGDRCPDPSRVEPAEWIDGDEPPVTIVHGTADRVAPPQGSVRFADALRAAGVPVTVRLADGGDHRGAVTDAAVAAALAELRAQLAEDRSSR